MPHETPEETITQDLRGLAVASRRLSSATTLLGAGLAILDLEATKCPGERTPLAAEYESVLRAVLDVMAGDSAARRPVEDNEDVACTTLNVLLREAAQVIPPSASALASVIRRAANAVEDDERSRRHVEMRLRKLARDVDDIRRKSGLERERARRLPAIHVPGHDGSLQLEPIDCVVVADDNVMHLKEQLTRLTTLTARPCHVIVVDEASCGEVRDFLGDFQKGRPNVTVVLSGRRLNRCQATNAGLSFSTAPWIFCFSGNLPIPLYRGWEEPLLEYMRQHPTVGITGTLKRADCLLTGRDYERLDSFRHFRQKAFALENRDRVFAQIEQGFYLLRRPLLEEVGYFNEAVSEENTEAEYAYCAESRGWELGEVPATRQAKEVAESAA